MELHRPGETEAERLIRDNKVIRGTVEEWQSLKPSESEKEQLITNRGMELYSRWHLGVTPSEDPSSRAAYHFVMGDFESIHEGALKEIIQTAEEHYLPDIRYAAESLLDQLT